MPISNVAVHARIHHLGSCHTPGRIGRRKIKEVEISHEPLIGRSSSSQASSTAELLSLSLSSSRISGMSSLLCFGGTLRSFAFDGDGLIECTDMPVKSRTRSFDVFWVTSVISFSGARSCFGGVFEAALFASEAWSLARRAFARVTRILVDSTWTEMPLGSFGGEKKRFTTVTQKWAAKSKLLYALRAQN